MKNTITLSLAAIVMVLGFGVTNTTLAQGAEDVKIGYVNPQQELVQKEQAFQAEVTTYQQKIGVISAEAQAQEEERLGQLQAELVQAQQTAETELEQKRQELVGPLLEQIGNAINVVADRMELTYVLNTTTSTGDLVILYASEEYSAKYNITEAVMEELGMF